LIVSIVNRQKFLFVIETFIWFRRWNDNWWRKNSY